MADLNEIPVSALNLLIGTPHCPVVVDVSTDEDFDADPFLIPGSVRHPHTNRTGLAELLRGRSAVILCQKGLKLSQGVTAWLRSDGVEAGYLAGGMYGWRDAPDTMRIPAQAIPDFVDGSTLWVTSQRPKIGSIACVWLVRRFVDRSSRFLFVSPSAVEGVASRFGATPLPHPDEADAGDGHDCSFDRMLDRFRLDSAALRGVAAVIRAAALNQPEHSPQAAGLRALFAGLSRLHPDDQALSAAGLSLCDALYAWVRDSDETDRPQPASSA